MDMTGTPGNPDVDIDQLPLERDRMTQSGTPGEKPPLHMKNDPIFKTEKTRSGSIDPSKYKTAMCRNWEANGFCNFRGCTFAHGNGELRLARPSHADECYPSSHPLHVEPSLIDDNEAKTRWHSLHQPSAGQFPQPNQHEIRWHVDQVLHGLAEAIDAERQFCINQQNERRQLDMLLEKEKVYHMQRRKDQQEIHDLHERVHYLENIIVQSEIDENSAHLG